MSATAEQWTETAAPVACEPAPIVIVGTGPVGIRVAEELLRRNPEISLVLYGGEPWEPYNRVRLSSLLQGDSDFRAIQNPLNMPASARVVQYHNRPIVSIDRHAQTVCDKLGCVQPYSALILATGSHAHIPSIPGIDRKGVYTFRDLDDVQKLMARRARSRRTLVLGGGLLGLEAARGLQKANTEVWVLDHAPYLMPRQLDAEAAERLREHVMSLGIRVLLNDGIQEVLGADQITGVRLRSGREIECDSLVLATGIKSNIHLALDAGISVGKGIRVDDDMRTSDPYVFAVGECTEHRGHVYGLVAPGLEQAGVAAHVITGGWATYRGSLAATRLKVVGLPVFSMGDIGDDDPGGRLRSTAFEKGKNYRRLFVDRGRVVGAIAIGEWRELGRVQESIARRRRIWPWQIMRFRSTGALWSEQEAQHISEWPAGATVCHCTGVTRGRLSEAFAQGNQTVEALARCTGASTVCGSCRPLLADLTGSGAKQQADVSTQVLLWLSLATLLIAVAVGSLAPIPFTSSVQLDLRFDQLWLDSLWKQISGFTMLGLSVLAGLLSLRKRIRKFTLGKFASWRLVHVVLGLLALSTLVVHTGLNMGENLNFLLMICFVGLALLGGAAGAANAWRGGAVGMAVKRRWGWAHLLLIWPLPVLLSLHIVSVYYF